MARPAAPVTFAERAAASQDAQREVATVRARLWKPAVALTLLPIALVLRPAALRIEPLLLGTAAWAYVLLLYGKCRLRERALRRAHQTLLGELAAAATDATAARNPRH